MSSTSLPLYFQKTRKTITFLLLTIWKALSDPGTENKRCQEVTTTPFLCHLDANGGVVLDSFIVRFWAFIFSCLRWVSLFQIISKLFPRLITYGFVEVWVLLHLIFSFISIWVVQHTQNVILHRIILIYAMMRVFEIIVYQVDVLLFDEYRASYKTGKYFLRSYRRTVILLLHNFAEIIFWFAASYIILSGEFFIAEACGKSVFHTIHSSFVVMTNFGTPQLHPSSKIGFYVIWGQSLVGLFMTLISLARFINLLPKPDTIDELEKEKK